ncbi:DUF2793 domain-containing protein [Erythrobacter sp. SD-21]|uniref:DUF2793 domain-containing protein n=1 Tax=Erythrobacter sp. SD-21 TaxID=161528 RepID=UPI000153F696|nr:DUF2793 domain-containing protein [Erythrobacter sp. SD-21]EDL49046.1 hypothetical protein ED21_20239 [Erythrobacter sp. SD-21]
MTQTADFLYATPRHALPILFAGQAQKEFTVNEALARIDLLLHPAVSGSLSAPPEEPITGDCYLVANDATGAFAGQDGAIAGWDGNQWTFVAPRNGMRLYDNTSLQVRHFIGSWTSVATPVEPNGGSVIDLEARATITELVDALKTLGVLA